MFHAEQDRTNRYGIVHNVNGEVYLKREIEAQEYLLKNIQKYKIPEAETLVTMENLKYYKGMLETLKGGNNG